MSEISPNGVVATYTETYRLPRIRMIGQVFCDSLGLQEHSSIRRASSSSYALKGHNNPPTRILYVRLQLRPTVCNFVVVVVIFVQVPDSHREKESK